MVNMILQLQGSVADQTPASVVQSLSLKQQMLKVDPYNCNILRVKEIHEQIRMMPLCPKLKAMRLASKFIEAVCSIRKGK